MAGLSAIRLDLGSEIGLLPKPVTVAIGLDEIGAYAQRECRLPLSRGARSIDAL